MTSSNQIDARWKLFVIFFLWVFFILVVFSIRAYGWVPVWASLRVPRPFWVFHDIGTIPWAIKTMHRGFDPLSFNPLTYPLNYPRLWLSIFSALDITDNKIVYVGVCLACLYLVGLSFLIYRSESLPEAMLVYYCSFSPASLMAIECGNNDQIIFFLLLIACLSMRPIVFSGLAFLASALKLYPVAALIISLAFKQYRLSSALALLTVFAVFLYSFGDIVKIAHSTPVGDRMSYGAVFIMREFDQRHETFSHHVRQAIHAAGMLALLAVMGCAFGAGLKNTYYTNVQSIREADRLLFFVFGSIYAGTFLVGSNWDYRLIFLIPLLPALIALYRQRIGYAPLAGIVFLLYTLYALVFFTAGWDNSSMISEIGLLGIIAYIWGIFLQNPGTVRSYVP